MRKRTLISFVIGIIALLGAVFVARLVARQVQASVVSAPIVVARRPIPPYTLITEEMLTVREYPRAVADAPIYRNAEELVGLAARVEIVPNAPIFKSYAVPPRELRYSLDNTVVLVALKVDTARAVGGLVQPGHRVDVWRIAKAPPDRALEPDTLLALHGAGVELLATDLRVVSVRAGQASQVAAPSGLGLGIGGAQEAAAETQALMPNAGASGNVSVVTVEAAQEIAPALVRLMGELGGVYDLWLTLSPLERKSEALTLARVYTPVVEQLDKAALLAALTPTPTPTPTATPTTAPTALPPPTTTPPPAPVAVVRPGSGAGLNVREGPGTEYRALALMTAGEKLEPIGRDESKRWLAVCCVDAAGDGVQDDLGWVLADLVDLTGVDLTHLPIRSAPPKPGPTARSPTDATGMDYRGQVEYRNEPGDKKLNYIRVRVIGGDGMGLGVGVSTSWPGGAVRCPGDIAPKGDGWCEFTATEGEFTVTLDGRGQPVTVTLPQNDQHTVATVVWRRLW